MSSQVVDDENRTGHNEVIDLRNRIQDCFEEISGAVRQNLCYDKAVDWEGQNPDEIDAETRNQMEYLDTVDLDYEDW